MKLETLLTGAAKDEASFKLLYEFTVDKIFRYFLARTGSREKSLDLVQNLYVELWRGLPRFSYRSDDQFYAYLFTIARRLMIRSWKFASRELPLTDDIDIVAPERSKEDYRLLLSGVESLKEKQRLVIKLRYFADLSFSEIAAALGVTENNAKVLHHRAIQELQKNTPSYA